MFVIFLNSLILCFFCLDFVSGQPNAFLPVLDAIPPPLLQELPGQYDMAFNEQRFGQRFTPLNHPIQQNHRTQRILQEQSGQIINYQRLNKLEKHTQMPPHHLQFNKPLNNGFKIEDNRRLNLNEMFENKRQNNKHHQLNNANINSHGRLLIDNLQENQPEFQAENYFEHKKTSDRDESLDSLIPKPPNKKLNEFEKGDEDMSIVSDPLAQNTPLGQMVSKMEEMLNNQEKKKEKEKEEGEQEMNQENTDSEDDYHMYFPNDDKKKKQSSNEEQTDDFKNFRTMKNANKQPLNSENSKSTSDNAIKKNLRTSTNKPISASNHQKLNKNLNNHKSKDKLNKKMQVSKQSQSKVVKKVVENPMAPIQTNKANNNQSKINLKLNSMGSRKRKLLQGNLVLEKSSSTPNKQTMKIIHKTKSDQSNQKSNDLNKKLIQSSNAPVDNKKMLRDNKMELKNTKNLTEVESKMLEQVQLDEDLETDLMVKDFDSGYDLKTQISSTIDKFPSYNQLLNNFENAELNTQEKFWNLDLEEIDPYKKIDLNPYFDNNKSKQDKQNESFDEKGEQTNDDQEGSTLPEKEYQNETKHKKLDRPLIKRTTTTATITEPETTTQQAQVDDNKDGSKKEDTIEGFEMQQFIEDPPPNNNNDEGKIDNDGDTLTNENDTASGNLDNKEENVSERRVQIRQRSIPTRSKSTLTGHSLIFDSKRLTKKF